MVLPEARVHAKRQLPCVLHVLEIARRNLRLSQCVRSARAGARRDCIRAEGQSAMGGSCAGAPSMHRYLMLVAVCISRAGGCLDRTTRKPLTPGVPDHRLSSWLAGAGMMISH